MKGRAARGGGYLRTTLVAVSMMWAIGVLADEVQPAPDPAAAMREQYVSLAEQLEQSPIQRGLYLDSAESSRASRGDVYAVVDYTFASIRDTFTGPDHWCDALILHLNVKYCHADVHDGGIVLSVAIGRKTEQPLKDTYRVEFTYTVAVSAPDYLRIVLAARKGPLGTRNYDISLELIPLGSEKSFLHVHYAYAYGLVARLAMGVYLATDGSSKVGFTMIEGAEGRPRHLVGGVRGALERNIMRYYLALDAHLGALATPAPERFAESLERWFGATEHHALQLHEVDYDAYVEMKRSEYRRQQQVPP